METLFFFNWRLNGCSVRHVDAAVVGLQQLWDGD